MDRIKAIIAKQLQVTSLELLQVQNHIYGCFILMEDIVGKPNALQEYNYTNANYTFNIDEQFEEIGIRYGFLMDTKLIYESYLPEYKAAWLEIYRDIGQKTTDDSDRLEDEIIELIKTSVAPEMAFFLHALQTGSLSQEWLHKVIKILTSKPDEAKPEDVKTVSVETENSPSGLVNAAIEKQTKRFRNTKRYHSIMIKKPLAKTRRALKLHGLKT
jgi:hypothetical protein